MSTVNKLGCFKSRYLQNSPYKFTYFWNKGNFEGRIFEELTSKILNNSDQCIQVTYKVNKSKLNTTIDEPNWS